MENKMKWKWKKILCGNFHSSSNNNPNNNYNKSDCWRVVVAYVCWCGAKRASGGGMLLVKWCTLSPAVAGQFTLYKEKQTHTDTHTEHTQNTQNTQSVFKCNFMFFICFRFYWNGRSDTLLRIPARNAHSSGYNYVLALETPNVFVFERDRERWGGEEEKMKERQKLHSNIVRSGWKFSRPIFS